MAEKKAKPAQSGKKIKVTLVKGITATKHKHRETVKGLGLKHRSHTVELTDTPSVRGMINRVNYLVKVEE
jgi:large subunit ribosomal protein L30